MAALLRGALRAVRPFVADADAVVTPVETRADPQALAQASEPDAQVGVLQVLAELHDRHHRDELARRDADQLGHHHHDAVVQQRVEQVVAVVAPHRHLALRMVQRMQVPPPAQLVLAAVDPVLEEVEDHQVDQQADQRQVGDAGPHLVDMESAPALHPQQAEQLVEQRVGHEEQRHPEDAQPVDQRVEDVDPDRRLVPHRLGRPPALQRADHRHHHQQLQHPDQQPAGGVVGVLQQVAHVQREHQGLHHGLEEPLLGGGKKIGDRVHGSVVLRGGARRRVRAAAAQRCWAIHGR